MATQDDPDTPLAVHTVTVGERLDATYVFADYDDAQAFLKAVEGQDRLAVYDEQIIIDHETAQRYIADQEDGS